MSDHQTPPLDELLPQLHQTAALLYFSYVCRQNGKPWYHNDEYNIDIEINPDMVGELIKVNIIDEMLRLYGQKKGRKNAAIFLAGMIATDVPELAQIGLETMNDIMAGVAKNARNKFIAGELPAKAEWCLSGEAGKYGA